MFWFIFIAFLTSIECRKETKQPELKLHEFACHCNPEFWEKCNGSLSPGLNSQVFDFEGHLIKNITNDFHISFWVYKRTKPEAPFREVFKNSFELCRLLEGFVSQVVVRPWVQNIKRFTNFPLNCPVLENHYHVKKFKPNRKSIPLVESGIYKLDCSYYVLEGGLKNEVLNSSMMVEIDV